MRLFFGSVGSSQKDLSATSTVIGGEWKSMRGCSMRACGARNPGLNESR
jgi:hypothetical protein